MNQDRQFFSFSLHQKVNPWLCGALIIVWCVWLVFNFFTKAVNIVGTDTSAAAAQEVTGQ